MRRSVLTPLLCLGCTFDASGLGQAPGVTTGGITTVPMASPTSTDTSAVDSSANPSTDETVGVSGSGSMSGGLTSSDATTTTTTTTTDPGTTTVAPGTSAMGSSGGCVPVPGYADMDHDGNGDPNMPTMGCAGDPGFATNNIDCNDSEPAAWMGHPENCDGVDNDCDGKLDEYDPNGNSESCGGCDFDTRNGHLYLFCDSKKDWLNSRVYCKYFSLDLMIENDTSEHAWVLGKVIGNIETWWIGGERFSSPQYKWVDGAAMQGGGWPWAGGEPNHSDGGLTAECVAYRVDLIDCLWADYVCTKSFKFICEGPIP